MASGIKFAVNAIPGLDKSVNVSDAPVKDILISLNAQVPPQYKAIDEKSPALNALFPAVEALQANDEKKAKQLLFKLNTALFPITYLAGPKVSVYDFFAVEQLKALVSSWNVKEQSIYCNITRWFNNIQHLDELEQTEKVDLIQVKPPPEKKKNDKDGGKGKGGKADGGKKGQKQQKPAAKELPLDISRCNFVVGKVVEVEKHPNADSLYVEKIDLGEASGPRTIVSGLVKFISVDDFKDRLVVVFANLKPSNLKSIKSFGMVLCGSSDDHSQVELLEPPAGTKIGERVMCEGFDGEPDDSINMKKKTCPWPKIQPDLRVNDTSVASYKGVALTTSAGKVTVKSLKNVVIS